jgi:hypothetical protein
LQVGASHPRSRHATAPPWLLPALPPPSSLAAAPTSLPPPPHAATARALRWPATSAHTPKPWHPQDQFDSVDLSDNEIRKLECMAVLPRLKMLLLSNNRISRCGQAAQSLRSRVGRTHSRRSRGVKRSVVPTRPASCA